MPLSSSERAALDHARRRYAAADYAGALQTCLPLLRSSPREPDVLIQAALAELALGLFERAIPRLESAASLRPGDPEPGCVLAMALARVGRLDDAQARLDAARALVPDYPRAASVQAEICLARGDDAGAYAVLSPMRGRLTPMMGVTLGRVCARIKRFDEALAVLERVELDPATPPVQRIPAIHARAEALDAMERVDEAMTLHARVHEMMDTGFAPEEFLASVDRAIAGWSPEAVAWAPRSRAPSQRPIFIVGLPRSGTSLVEQILASHPKVFGGDELLAIDEIARRQVGGAGPERMAIVEDPSLLTAARLDADARAYLALLARLSPSADRVTDKLPQNLLHLGLIAALFPGARVVICERDVLDACVSIHTHLFAASHPYQHSWRGLAAFAAGCARLSEHWCRVLPLRVHRVRYEELVAEQERCTRSLVEFAGLGWDPACLRFHESRRVVSTSSTMQVRRPMFASSVGRWKRYRARLGPLIDALREFGVRVPITPEA